MPSDHEVLIEPVHGEVVDVSLDRRDVHFGQGIVLLEGEDLAGAAEDEKDDFPLPGDVKVELLYLLKVWNGDDELRGVEEGEGVDQLLVDLVGAIGEV